MEEMRSQEAKKDEGIMKPRIKNTGVSPGFGFGKLHTPEKDHNMEKEEPKDGERRDDGQ